jgi:hypothetical protein
MVASSIAATNNLNSTHRTQKMGVENTPEMSMHGSMMPSRVVGDAASNGANDSLIVGSQAAVASDGEAAIRNTDTVIEEKEEQPDEHQHLNERASFAGDSIMSNPNK